MCLKKIGLHTLNMLIIMGSTIIIIEGGGVHGHYGLTLWTFKNHSIDKGAHKIPQSVAKISYHICGSKKIPNYEIQSWESCQTLASTIGNK